MWRGGQFGRNLNFVNFENPHWPNRHWGFFCFTFTKTKKMIYSKFDILKIERSMKFVLDLIHFDVNDDLFVYAFSIDHLDFLRDVEKTKNLKLMKTNWPKLIEKNGVVFNINSHYNKKKQSEKIKMVFENIKIEHPNFDFDVIVKNETFDVFLVYEKKIVINEIDLSSTI